MPQSERVTCQAVLTYKIITNENVEGYVNICHLLISMTILYLNSLFNESREVDDFSCMKEHHKYLIVFDYHYGKFGYAAV